MADIPIVSIEEVILFFLVNLIILLFGIILYYYIWIKSYGGVIPVKQIGNEEELTFFNSKNFVIVITELWNKIKEFDKRYMIRSIGLESYVYLLFQRSLISLLFTMSIISIIISIFSTFLSDNSKNTSIQNFFLNNKYLNDFTTKLHIISVILFTFLHFRCFSMIKTQAKYLYFDRFDQMSRNKSADWLSCRTLHVSGLGPNERSSKF